jgi:hypothetical protein
MPEIEYPAGVIPKERELTRGRCHGKKTGLTERDRNQRLAAALDR